MKGKEREHDEQREESNCKVGLRKPQLAGQGAPE